MTPTDTSLDVWAENFALKGYIEQLCQQLRENESALRAMQLSREAESSKLIAQIERFHQSEKRNREIAEIHRQVLQMMNSAGSLHELLQFILDQAIRVSGVDCGAIFRVNTQTHTMTMEASSGVSTQEKDFAVHVPEALLQRARRYETLLPNTVANVLIAGIMKDEVLREKFSPLTIDLRCGMAAQFKIDGDIYGGIMLCSRSDRTFTREDHEFTEALARQATLAIENARLRIIAAQNAAEEERARLARELHDSVNQAVFGVVLGAQTAQQIAKTAPEKIEEPLNFVLEMAQAALTEMRALIFQLRPDLLEREGLLGVLRAQADSLRVRHHIDVDLDLIDSEPNISDDTKDAVYRIASEAIHNVVKHSHATHLQLALRVSDDALRLTIRDNGIGFDTSADYSRHLGLRSMRERVAHLSGKITIESERNHGSRITVMIPTAIVKADAPSTIDSRHNEQSLAPLRSHHRARYSNV
jgi:signal transduction histidine kinase